MPRSARVRGPTPRRGRRSRRQPHRPTTCQVGATRWVAGSGGFVDKSTSARRVEHGQSSLGEVAWVPDAILDDRPQSDGLETIGGGDHRERPTGGCLADQHYQSSLPRTQRFAVGESFDEWPMPEVNSEPLDFRGASMFVHSCPEADGSNLEVLGFLPPKPHRTQRVPSMDQEQLIRRLSLPRFLFRAGARALGGPGPYAPGLATSLFQDSVEAFLRILAETGGVDLKSQVSFDGLVDKVSKSYPSVSGHKAALFRLNKIRVAFKHYGTSISGEDALHFREGAQAFLRETTRDALGLDFERASLVSVIGHRRTENRLLEAQEAVEAEHLREALDCAAVALQTYLNARSVHRDAGHQPSSLGPTTT